MILQTQSYYRIIVGFLQNEGNCHVMFYDVDIRYSIGYISVGAKRWHFFINQWGRTI